MNWAQYLTFDNVMMGLLIVPLSILAWAIAATVLWELIRDVPRR